MSAFFFLGKFERVNGFIVSNTYIVMTNLDIS